MQNEKKRDFGVFVNTNKGEIIDCHGKLSLEKQNDDYSFCVNNSGVILNSVEEEECNCTIDKKGKFIDREQNITVIEICSKEQLLEISRQVNLGDPFYCRGTYRLLEDLDLQGTRWIPMGKSEQYPFSGTFDGNGHAIKNMFIYGTRQSYVGFFGYLKNAKIHNVSIEGIMKGGRCTGSMVGLSEESCIQACFASAKVLGAHCVGGFIGENRGRIAHCYFSGNVQHRRIIFHQINGKNSSKSNLRY